MPREFEHVTPNQWSLHGSDVDPDAVQPECCNHEPVLANSACSAWISGIAVVVE